MPNIDHLEVPQSEEEVLAGNNKETREKVDELKRYFK